jgi:hypothetical protein
MVRTLRPWTGARAGTLTRLTAAALLLASAMLARWADRLQQHATTAAPARETGVLVIDGRVGLAVHEDGRLVGWLPDVTRL